VRTLTQRKVNSLRASSRTRIVWDGEVPGFGVRITPNGVVSFLLAYRFNRRQTKYTFGQHPGMTVEMARSRVRKLRDALDEGKNPQMCRGGEGITFEELSEEFMKVHAEVNLRKGTVRGYREMLRDHILPEIGKQPLTDVRRLDIERIKAKLKGTPYRANRVVALVSSICNKGIEWEYEIEKNPAEHVEPFLENEREFALTEQQYKALEAAITSYGRECGEAIRLLLLTGARKMEVLSAPWAQFDLERGLWTRPAHTTKEKKTEHIVLSDATLIVLRRMKEKATSAYLFPGKKAHRKTISKPWIKICKAAGLATEYEIPGEKRMLKRWRPIMRLHDLRHSFASWLVSDGFSLKRVGELMGHSSEATTERYAHLADRSMREVTNKFGNMVTGIVQ
jgi:integrase